MSTELHVPPMSSPQRLLNSTSGGIILWSIAWMMVVNIPLIDSC